MSSGSEKVAVECPSCNKRLLVPATSMGKQGRCPVCQSVFTLEQLFEAESVPSPATDQFDAFAPASNSWNTGATTSQFASGGGDYQLQPTPQNDYATAMNAYASPQVTQVSPYQPAPQPAQGQFWDNSLLGGIALMAIAVVWFFGGLFFDIIFIYPPIMFIIGAFVAVKGLVAGKITG